MKLIEQSFEIIDRGKYTPAQLIELCGRVCYKSEDKITEDSVERFVRGLVKKGHLSVIEHGHMAFEIKPKTYVDFFDYIEITNFLNISDSLQSDGKAIISGNLRAWIEFVKNAINMRGETLITRELKRYIRLYCKPAYDAAFGVDKMTYIGSDFSHNIKSISFDKMTDKEREIHEPVTVRIITNRSVTHELVRHRPASYSQESTRYVNYGDQEMQFIKPVWWNDELWENHEEFEDTGAMGVFWLSCNDAEVDYNNLLKCGWKPEQAREVLPNALKTEIIMTATKKEWRHVFNLRTAKGAHPQIRALMKDIEKEMFGSVTE